MKPCYINLLPRKYKAIWRVIGGIKAQRRDLETWNVNDCSNQCFQLHYYWSKIEGNTPQLLICNKGNHALVWLPGKGIFDPANNYRYVYKDSKHPMTMTFGEYKIETMTSSRILIEFPEQFTWGTYEKGTKKYLDKKLRKY